MNSHEAYSIRDEISLGNSKTLHWEITNSGTSTNGTIDVLRQPAVEDVSARE